MKRILGTDAPAEPLSVGMATAAKMLGCGRRKLWELCNRKAIPHFRIGNRIMFNVAALQTWIDDQTIGGDV